MISKFSILFLSTVLIGCQQKSDNVETPSDDKKNDTTANIEPVEKPEPKYEYDRILISLYDNYMPSNDYRPDYGPFSTGALYETKDENIFSKFKKMTAEAEQTGYCCCPEYNYTIAFYDGLINYEDYYVDTMEFKDKVRIFQQSFQFSYIVEKAKWKMFLSEMTPITFNEYFTTDLETMRKVYSYTLENDLVTITSNRVSKEWMNFDGDFKVKVADVGGGEKMDENKIQLAIKNAYPNDTFKIETVSYYQMAGSYDGHDRYEEMVLRIYCNQNFYDKFNIYSPKSFFDKSMAEFYVVGTREELDKIDQIAEKNK